MTTQCETRLPASPLHALSPSSASAYCTPGHPHSPLSRTHRRVRVAIDMTLEAVCTRVLAAVIQHTHALQRNLRPHQLDGASHGDQETHALRGSEGRVHRGTTRCSRHTLRSSPCLGAGLQRGRRRRKTAPSRSRRVVARSQTLTRRTKTERELRPECPRVRYGPLCPTLAFAGAVSCVQHPGSTLSTLHTGGNVAVCRSAVGAPRSCAAGPQRRRSAQPAVQCGAVVSACSPSDALGRMTARCCTLPVRAALKTWLGNCSRLGLRSTCLTKWAEGGRRDRVTGD